MSLLTVSVPSIWPELAQSVKICLEMYTDTVLVAFENEQLSSCCIVMEWYDSEVFHPKLIASSKLFCTPPFRSPSLQILALPLSDLRKSNQGH